jgi:DNA-binding transcriptional LysR family regulator
MELYQLRYFLAVAETLNFTRASERSFVSQPALTKAIQRLEEAMGGRLFDRSKNSVTLTRLGEAMQPNFREIYANVIRAREQARELTRGQRSAVRVGVMCTVDFTSVLPGFVESQEGHTEVALSFEEGNLEGLTDALDRGDIDLGLMCSPWDIPKRFSATPLFSEDYVLAVGDDHRFVGRSAVEMMELNRENYCERLNCEYTVYIERLMQERSVDVEVVQRSAREDWIQALVRGNFGVAFMPVSLARAARLNFVRIANVPIVRTVSVLALADRPLSEAQQSVLGSLAAHAWA